MSWFIFPAVLLVVAACGVLLLALRSRGPAWSAPPCELEPAPVDAQRVAEGLAGYLAIDTSIPPGSEGWPVAPSGQPAWLDYLRERWLEPLDLEHHVLPGGSLVVFVPADDERSPVLFLDHVDVVPVGEGTLDRWTHPPFGGVIADGFVWGRGALDNKGCVIMALEALRLMREAGMAPSRRLVLLVTPDEEVDGQQGSGLVVREHLADLGSPEILLDEGSFVLPDFYPGLTVAAVALAEKSFLRVSLKVEGEAGHASMPSPDTPSAVLSRALQRVADWEPPAELSPLLQETLWRIGGAKGFPLSLVLRNPRLTWPLLRGIFQRTTAGNAVIRDTVAITVVRAGQKENVLPGVAEATLNVRLLPGHEPDAFLAQLRDRIADSRVQLSSRAWPGRDRAGSWRTPTFCAIEAAIGAALGPVDDPLVVVPITTPGTTDSRWFTEAGLAAYRFHPLVLDAAERAGIHGIDERVSIDNLARGTRFYQLLFRLL
jgi:carboxypeptidase PM20D1